jgi:hypothetical protein
MSGWLQAPPRAIKEGGVVASAAIRAEMPMRRQIRRAIATAFGAMLALPSVSFAATYEFVPAPQTDLNRIYRVEKYSGEVSSCQYGLQEGSVGATLCFGAGEGAGPQPPGEYGIVSSRHEREGGVFRVNYRTGEMSVCYVFDEKVVCTPQTTPPPAARPAGTPPGSSTTQRP